MIFHLCILNVKSSAGVKKQNYRTKMIWSSSVPSYTKLQIQDNCANFSCSLAAVSHYIDGAKFHIYYVSVYIKDSV